jgi:hypothetical protein
LRIKEKETNSTHCSVEEKFSKPGKYKGAVYKRNTNKNTKTNTTKKYLIVF